MVTIYMESSNGNAKDKGFFVLARKSLYCLNAMNIYDGILFNFLPINMPVIFFCANRMCIVFSPSQFRCKIIKDSLL